MTILSICFGKRVNYCPLMWKDLKPNLNDVQQLGWHHASCDYQCFAFRDIYDVYPDSVTLLVSTTAASQEV